MCVCEIVYNSSVFSSLSHVCLNKRVCVGHERCSQRGEVVLTVGARAELADV